MVLLCPEFPRAKHRNLSGSCQPGAAQKGDRLSHNTWIHRAARVLVRPLANTPVTPNQLTALRLASGLLAAWAFAQGTHGGAFWGALIFLVSMVLDRADGELARLTGRTSPWGHKFDLWSDAVANAAAFVGIGVGAAAALGWVGPALGLAAGLGIVAVLALVTRVEAARGARAAELQGTGGFDPDDAMLVVPITMMLGLNEMLIVAAGVGAPAFAAAMWQKFR